MLQSEGAGKGEEKDRERIECADRGRNQTRNFVSLRSVIGIRSWAIEVKCVQYMAFIFH
jgi:hypothetical protein